jgi:acetyl/propionyl-CoA carboxylase alpha subunit
MIKSLLIANRGEIAVRIVRACRELGVRSVLTVSEADTHSLAAQMADETVVLGAPEPAKSYLRIDAVVEAAQNHDCEAVHPGYGFLSERPEFAEACAEAGLIFVGPSASAMRQLGAKIDAKKLAQECGVPITPGFFQAGATDEQLAAAADEIGYPVMLKASAGGGGRGMRVVHDPAEIRAQLGLAREEALKGFGEDEMMVEKLIERPRHIEVQIMADGDGQVACLFERECSLQRRHQKVIEESASPVMSDQLWQEMRAAATKLILACDYKGAGTVEFMTNAEANEFYFLEVNARLQVEHPVTESVTGVDLVQQQLRVASGEPMTISSGLIEGDRGRLVGHSIEARIIAEDPAHGFLPSIGQILAWHQPTGPGIRVDTGFREGAEVTPYYDSLLAKLIVHAENRAAAINRMRSALMDFHVLGVKTNISFLIDLVSHPGFASGDIDTGFIGREFEGWRPNDEIPVELGDLVGMAAGGSTAQGKTRKGSSRNAWAEMDGFRNA